MPHPDLVATWFVAKDDADPEVIEAWCRAAAADPRVTVHLQAPPGRGRLASGRGVLVAADRSHGFAVPDGDWWAERFDAPFELQRVNEPEVAAEPGETPYMLVTRTYPPDEMREEFRRWLEVEHSQVQLKVPGNNWYLGYEETEGRRSFMNFWGLDGPEVPESETWDRMRLTDWRERMVPAMAGMDRGIYRTVRPEGD
jgi:hypothetical protein